MYRCAKIRFIKPIFNFTYQPTITKAGFSSDKKREESPETPSGLNSAY